MNFAAENMVDPDDKTRWAGSSPTAQNGYPTIEYLVTVRQNKQIIKDMNVMSDEALLIKLADRLEKLQRLSPGEKANYLNKTNKIIKKLYYFYNHF